MKRARLTLPGTLFLVALLWSCADEPNLDEPMVASHEAVQTFAIRGRYMGPQRLLVHVDDEPGPLKREALSKELDQALRCWEAASPFAFEQAESSAEAHIVVGWRGTEHADCRPFIPWTGEFAHTTSMGERSAIHLCADSQWTLNGGEGGQGLFQTLLHEIGHVLGLAHNDDPRTLMYPAYDESRNVITDGERAGMVALYGGRTRVAGSIVIERDGEPIAGPLVGVAPHGKVQVALAEVDDTEGCEILIFPATLEDESRGLRVFGFSAGPWLRQSHGPIVGALESRYTTCFVIRADGAPAVLQQLSDGRILGRVMDLRGIPGGMLPAADVDRCAEALGFRVDGNYTVDGERLKPSGIVSAPGATLMGDLDGDGRAETIRIL